MARADHCGEVEHRPARALHTVGAQFVVVAEEARDAAEVDHGGSMPPQWLRG